MFVMFLLCSLQCLLNETEIEIKTKLWMEENKDYLEKQKGEFTLFLFYIVCFFKNIESEICEIFRLNLRLRFCVEYL